MGCDRQDRSIENLAFLLLEARPAPAKDVSLGPQLIVTADTELMPLQCQCPRNGDRGISGTISPTPLGRIVPPSISHKLRDSNHRVTTSDNQNHGRTQSSRDIIEHLDRVSLSCGCANTFFGEWIAISMWQLCISLREGVQELSLECGEYSLHRSASTTRWRLSVISPVSKDKPCETRTHPRPMMG